MKPTSKQDPSGDIPSFLSIRHAKKGDCGVKPFADFIPEITREVAERKL